MGFGVGCRLCRAWLLALWAARLVVFGFVLGWLGCLMFDCATAWVCLVVAYYLWLVVWVVVSLLAVCVGALSG